MITLVKLSSDETELGTTTASLRLWKCERRHRIPDARQTDGTTSRFDLINIHVDAAGNKEQLSDGTQELENFYQ